MIVTLYRDVIDPYLRTVDSVAAALRKRSRSRSLHDLLTLHFGIAMLLNPATQFPQMEYQNPCLPE